MTTPISNPDPATVSISPSPRLALLIILFSACLLPLPLSPWPSLVVGLFGIFLLVQTYIGMDDLFQAQATANSILANVQVAEVQEAVSDLLLEIDALKAATTEPNQE